MTEQEVESMKDRFILKKEVLQLLRDGLVIPKNSKSLKMEILNGEEAKKVEFGPGRPSLTAAQLKEREEKARQDLKMADRENKTKKSNLMSAAKSRSDAKELREWQTNTLTEVLQILKANRYANRARTLLKLFKEESRQKEEEENKE